MLTNANYNPDVLSCIANLSSDEVKQQLETALKDGPVVIR
jgi:hypothetical protein